MNKCIVQTMCTEPSLLNQEMNLFLLFPLTGLFQLTASWQLMESDLKQALGRNQLLCVILTPDICASALHMSVLCLHLYCYCMYKDVSFFPCVPLQKYAVYFLILSLPQILRHTVNFS